MFLSLCLALFLSLCLMHSLLLTFDICTSPFFITIMKHLRLDKFKKKRCLFWLTVLEVQGCPTVGLAMAFLVTESQSVGHHMARDREHIIHGYVCLTVSVPYKAISIK
jgi:hypothetical protein